MKIRSTSVHLRKYTSVSMLIYYIDWLIIESITKPDHFTQTKLSAHWVKSEFLISIWMYFSRYAQAIQIWNLHGWSNTSLANVVREFWFGGPQLLLHPLFSLSNVFRLNNLWSLSLRAKAVSYRFRFCLHCYLRWNEPPEKRIKCKY